MPGYRTAVTGFTLATSPDEIVRNVSKLYVTKPREFALTAMLMTRGMEYNITNGVVNVSGKPMGTIIVDNPKFEQQLDALEAVKTTINLPAGYASGDTSIVVTDGSLVPTNALLYVARTGEIMRATATTTNTCTVARGTSGTTAAALVNGDDLHILGSAYSENATSGDISSLNTTFDYNYTQIDREAYGTSRTVQSAKVYGINNNYDFRKKKALLKFLRRWNQRMWVGGRSIDSTNTYRTMGGILSFIDSGNVYDVNGNLTQAEFEFWLRKYALAYNNTRKTLFAGSRLIERVNAWANDRNITTREVGIVGMGLSVRTYSTAWGDIDIVYEPNFDEFQQGTTPLSTYGVCLDLDLIKMVYYNSGVLKAFDDIQENDRDGRKGEWLMEGSVQINVPLAHAIIRGI